MHPRFRAPAVVGVILASLATVTACGPAATPSPTRSAERLGRQRQAAEIFPLIISNELIVGDNRIIFTFQEAERQADRGTRSDREGRRSPARAARP